MHLTLKKEATRPAATNFPAAASEVRSLPRVLHESVRVECAPNPFEAKVLPMRPV